MNSAKSRAARPGRPPAPVRGVSSFEGGDGRLSDTLQGQWLCGPGASAGSIGDAGDSSGCSVLPVPRLYLFDVFIFPLETFYLPLTLDIQQYGVAGVQRSDETFLSLTTSLFWHIGSPLTPHVVGVSPTVCPVLPVTPCGYTVTTSLDAPISSPFLATPLPSSRHPHQCHDFK